MPLYVLRVITKTKDRICSLDKYGNNHVTASLKEIKERKKELEGLNPQVGYQIHELKLVKEKE